MTDSRGRDAVPLGQWRLSLHRSDSSRRRQNAPRPSRRENVRCDGARCHRNELATVLNTARPMHPKGLFHSGHIAISGLQLKRTPSERGSATWSRSEAPLAASVAIRPGPRRRELRIASPMAVSVPARRAFEYDGDMRPWVTPIQHFRMAGDEDDRQLGPSLWTALAPDRNHPSRPYRYRDQAIDPCQATLSSIATAEAKVRPCIPRTPADTERLENAGSSSTTATMAPVG